MLQFLLVCLIVTAAALSAAWRLMGLASRVKVLEALLRQGPGAGALHGVIDRLARKQRAALVSGACAACSAHASHKKAPRVP
jgi:hypothetical protein